MKGVIPADRPLFEISSRVYLCGADVVALARAADRASEGRDVTMMFTLSVLEVRAVVDSIRHILICIPHLDPIRPGRRITGILPETLVEAGVRMVMLNRAEHPITFIVLEKAMQRAAEVGLAAAVYVNSFVEVRAVAFLSPDLLVAEPTGLIGTDKPSGFDYVRTSSRAVHEINPDVRVLQGARISTPTDVEAAIRSETNVTRSSSAITTASDPSVMAEAMIRAMRHGRDARPRS